ncbi:hypothetical protein SpCBS45565_g04309 [Spizellomyces sp. 'palustris']|nr:hypothetical protein SpCBS45565_g04309 [Spizellomyces sp. 'palustris']
MTGSTKTFSFSSTDLRNDYMQNSTSDHYAGNAENFINFGKKIRLPQTSLLAIKGPCPIPYHEGTGWAPAFDAEGNERPHSSAVVQEAVKTTRNLLVNLLNKAILVSPEAPDRWPAENIFLFGFSQGGVCAIDLVLFGTVRLGGAVSVSGWPSEALYSGKLPEVNKSVKMLITQGLNDEVIGHNEWKKRAVILDVKMTFLKRVIPQDGKLEVHEIPGKGHTMPNSAVEMRAIMGFFGANLSLRSLALEAMSDVYEVKMQPE